MSARTLPTMLDQCRVQSLADFFEGTIEALLALAPHRRDDPRVVRADAGAAQRDLLRACLLARHWGFPLVEGADLTVRDSRVFLKTLAGLNPVDVILRRLDDDFCDPLELRGDSLLGVPGLVQAVARGQRVHRQLPRQRPGGNAGAHGLSARPVPARARRRLAHAVGRDLVVRPGRAAARGARHLDTLVIKPAFPRFGQHAEFPAHDDRARARELAARFEAQPDAFVAQEQVDLSTAPVQRIAASKPRHVVLRVLAAWDGASYAVLPGGLTRVATGQESLVVSMQIGGGSKDTWVLGAAPRRTVPD